MGISLVIVTKKQAASCFVLDDSLTALPSSRKGALGHPTEDTGDCRRIKWYYSGLGIHCHVCRFDTWTSRSSHLRLDEVGILDNVAGAELEVGQGLSDTGKRSSSSECREFCYALM